MPDRERGREFQSTGPMYWKDLSPRVLLPNLGTRKTRVSAAELKDLRAKIRLVIILSKGVRAVKGGVKVTHDGGAALPRVPCVWFREGVVRLAQIQGLLFDGADQTFKARSNVAAHKLSCCAPCIVCCFTAIGKITNTWGQRPFLLSSVTVGHKVKKQIRTCRNGGNMCKFGSRCAS